MRVIVDGGAGTTGIWTSAALARARRGSSRLGAVTASDLDLAATSVCAVLAGSDPSHPSQLGPGVTATTSGTSGDCVEALSSAPANVTGVTVNAPEMTGVGIGDSTTLTDSTVNARTALIVTGGTVRRATLNGTAVGVVADSGGSPKAPLVSDSIVTSTGDGGIAVEAESDNLFAVAARLRNVTAIASGTNATGLEAQSQSASTVTAGAIDARNVIVRGTARDVFGEPGASSGCNGPCAPGEVTIGYSNFINAAGVLDTTIGHNQSANPLLVNPAPGAGQDFHIARADSSAIGAGTTDASTGSTDRDGVTYRNPRAIGAYEYAGPPGQPPGIPPPTGPAQPAVPGGGRRTATKPTISQLAETNRVFAVARGSTPLAGRTAAVSHKRGTTFSFRLDQSATVTVAITTRIRCRRTRLAPRPKLRCTRTLATLTRSAHPGLNKLPFSGRIHGKPVKPGNYRAVFAAAGRRGVSAPAMLAFRVVAR